MSDPQTPLQLQYVPLSDLLEWPTNPKLHDRPLIKSLIQRYGYIDPMILDETTGRLVAGHGRREVLQGMKQGGDAPPEHILVREGDGEWLIPVIRGVAFEDEDEATAFLVGHNEATIRGGYDNRLLTEALLQARDAGLLEVTGYSEADFLSRVRARLLNKGQGDKRITPEKFERQDYLVILVENELDWHALCAFFEVGTVEDVPVKYRTTPKFGTGRILRAAEVLERLRPLLPAEIVGEEA